VRLRKGDLPKLIAALLLIVASVGYLVVTLKQRGRPPQAAQTEAASTVSLPTTAVPQQPSEPPQTPPNEQTAVGPPSSELKPGMKLVVKVVDPFSLPPSAQKKTAEAQKPSGAPATTAKTLTAPSMPLPPAFVAEAMRPFITGTEPAQAQARPAASPAESPPVPPSLACTIEGDERIAILRTSTGRSVVVRTGDKVEGYRVASIRTGEVVLRASDGGTRVMTVGAKPNGS